MIELARFDGPDYLASESFQKFAVIAVIFAVDAIDRSAAARLISQG